MTWIFHKETENERSDSSGNWVTEFSAAGKLRDIEHIFQIYCEYTGDIGKKVRARVLVDGVPGAEESYVAISSEDFKSFSPIGVFKPDAPEMEHVLELQFKAEDLPNTVRARRTRLLVAQR
jgi:hypothetical protein